MTAAGRWREQLAAWTIPDEILAAAPEPPWGFSAEQFGRRGAGARSSGDTPTTARAAEVLPAGGTVIDVGVGGGAMSLPLAGRARVIVGVDAQPDMLEVFRSNALAAGVEARTVVGAWPEVADEVETADVVVAGHVVYNVAELGPFARALDEHAERRVVLELTETHPLAWMSDLWRRFHGLERPMGPTARDAEAVLAEVGLVPSRQERIVTADDAGGSFARREDAIYLVRKRLCLSADRDEEIADALGAERLRQIDGLWDVGASTRVIVTLWWDTSRCARSA